MINFEKVNKIYKIGSKPINVFENLNFSIHQGDFIKITGPNGSGKSTFLKLMKKLILPNHGKIIYGSEINDSDIALVSQNQRSFFLNLSVKQNLLFFCSLKKTKKIDLEIKIKEYLKTFNLIEKIDAVMSTLSSGQLKKISIIRALLSDPKVLLLDEITSNLEEESRNFFADYVCNELNHIQKISIIWTTHYPNEIKKDIEKSYTIKNSNLVKLSQ
jgi:ABC-type multidrug transport system ATPase subunit